MWSQANTNTDYYKECLDIFCVWRWHLCKCLKLLWVWFHTIPIMTSQKNGIDVHLKWHLSLFSFRFTCRHICSTLCSVSSWSLPSMSYPTTKISPAMSNTIGKSLNISSVFLWNISPAGAAPKGNLFYQYLPNCHANVVKYDDFSSSFKLWQLELTSIKEIYFTLFSLSKILLSVVPLCTSLMSAWFNFAKSRHSLTSIGFGN